MTRHFDKLVLLTTGIVTDGGDYFLFACLFMMVRFISFLLNKNEILLRYRRIALTGRTKGIYVAVWVFDLSSFPIKQFPVF